MYIYVQDKIAIDQPQPVKKTNNKSRHFNRKYISITSRNNQLCILCRKKESNKKQKPLKNKQVTSF